MWIWGRGTNPSPSLMSEWQLPIKIHGSLLRVASEFLSEAAFLVTKTDSWLTDKGRWRRILPCLWMFAESPLGPVLVKAGLVM